jgi:PAS domain S-box-containing protein
MKGSRSAAALAAEVRALRTRLAAAEDVQRAIRDGDVDAVVITGKGGEVVYTLHGADRIYRQLIETMNEGAATLSASGVILYGNPRFSQMLGRPLDQVVGTALRDYLLPVDQPLFDAVFASDHAEPARHEISLIGADGRLVPIYLSASRLPDDEAERIVCLVLTDLTDQKRNARIVEDERLARLILEETIEAIVVCDESGRIIRTSQAAKRLSDGSPLLRPFAKMFPLYVDAADAFDLAPVLQGKTVQNVDVTLDRHGKRFTLILNAGPLRRNERIIGCVVTLTDITERRQAVAALRVSEERFRVLFEQAPDVILLLELVPVGMPVIRDANSAALRILGYDRDELVGQTVAFIEAAPMDDNVIAQRRLALGGAKRITVEVTHRCKDGTVREFESSVTEMHIGSKTFAVAIERDVTERNKGLAELRLQSAALNAAASSMVITDRAGTVEWINPAFSTLTGYGAGEAIGHSLLDLILSGEDDPSLMEQLWATILAGRVFRGERTIRHKDGTLYTVALSVTPVKDAGGTIEHFITIARDLTDQKRLEAQFLQSQKMEAIGTLAGGVAHDFNNILAVVMMQAELSASIDGLPERARQGLREIGVAAARATNLTRQLLLFSRKEVMRLRELDLNDVVTNLVKMLQRIIGEDVHMQLNLHPHPLNTRADAGMLDQVLMNLVVNARDAMPGGGQIVIATGERTITTDNAVVAPDTVPGHYVSLRVTDSGGGISREHASRIFEPFFTTKDPSKGTGLGLATAFGIAKQHAGSLAFESVVGGGTTFELLLPASDGTGAKDTAAAEIPEPRGGTETILLVEDESAVRVLMHLVLETHGYRVLDAVDGVEALRLFEQHADAIDLLLTDVVMPAGISGRDLAAELQARDPDLRVILTSGYSSDIAGGDLQLGTGQAFLQKPCLTNEILTTVRRILDA